MRFRSSYAASLLTMNLVVTLGACAATHSRSSPAPSGPSTGGDPGQQRTVTVGERTLVVIALDQCANGKTIAASIALASDPAQSAYLQTQLDPSASSSCSKEAQVDLPELEAGTYNLDLKVTGSSPALSETHHVTVTAKTKTKVEATSQPKNPEPTDGASVSSAQWPKEKSAEVNCDAKSCDDQVSSYLGAGSAANISLAIYDGLDSADSAGWLSLNVEGKNPVHGTFTIKGNGFVNEPNLVGGDFEIRKGRLALRSEDKKSAYYFRWYNIADNGQSRIVLTGELPRRSGITMGCWLKKD